MSKKCIIIDYLQEQDCTVCCVSRKPFVLEVENTGYFIGCQSSDEKYDGTYLTLILLDNGCYRDAATYRVVERRFFDSFKETAEVMGTDLLGYKELKPKGFSDRMCRIFEPDSEYKAVVLKLKKQTYPIFNDPPIPGIAQTKIDEFKAHEKNREYLSLISQIPPISENEEQELAIQTINGNDEAKIKLAENYLMTCFEIAKHYVNQNHALIDLVQAGNLGIVNALKLLDRIDISQLSAHIIWMIRKGIMSEASFSYRCGCFPVHLVDKIKDYKSALNKLTDKYGRTPTDEELAEELDWDLDRVNDYLDLFDEIS